MDAYFGQLMCRVKKAQIENSQNISTRGTKNIQENFEFLLRMFWTFG